MFPYKLTVLDLDGTLPDSQKKISAGNLAALRNVRENGVFIAFSTARSAGAMREYIAAAEFEADTNDNDGVAKFLNALL